MRNICKNLPDRDFGAKNVSVKSVCIGGRHGARMVNAMTIIERRQIHMIKRILTNRKELVGPTGKRIKVSGAVEDRFIQ